MKILEQGVAALLLVVLLPFMLLIAVAVKLSSPGPVLFVQKRIGKDGKPFLIYKFRTMEVGAESRGKQTVPDDPRVTAVGRFLRKYHLDEWPQLWNVIIDDMSLVGPRPQVAEYFAGYKHLANYRLYISVRPGIAGLSSVRGQLWVLRAGKRSQLRVEAFYVTHRCFCLILRIIRDTTRIMFAGKSI
ncbi:MAG TPA: sugar transferase [Candidatus Paceibacterota bacterium]